MRISLRPLNACDSAVAAALHATAGLSEAWDEASFSGLLETSGVGGTAAIDGETELPAGLVLWRVVADEAEILTICVSPPFRRSGIGRLLLSNAIDAARSAGAARMALEVAVDNIAATRLYESFAFVSAGTRAGYYRTAAGAVDAAIRVREPL